MWIGVIIDPPYWYALKDWFNAGWAIRTQEYFIDQYTDQELSEQIQQNITW